MFKLIRKIITLVIVLVIAAIVYMLTSCSGTCDAYRSVGSHQHPNSGQVVWNR